MRLLVFILFVSLNVFADGPGEMGGGQAQIQEGRAPASTVVKPEGPGEMGGGQKTEEEVDYDSIVAKLKRIIASTPEEKKVTCVFHGDDAVICKGQLYKLQIPTQGDISSSSKSN